MVSQELQKLIHLLSKFPGLGPRSARRIVLHILKKREFFFDPLIHSLQEVAQTIKVCAICHNLDTKNPCTLCSDKRRDASTLCIVEDISDLWALERSGSFKGFYHVLGGTLSALDGIGPEQLNILSLRHRLEAPTSSIQEVILAFNLTVSGQTTTYYLAEFLEGFNLKVSTLAHGVPLGGELDYLDDGTLTTALNDRRPFRTCIQRLSSGC